MNLMEKDLAASGLVLADIHARPLGPTEAAHVGISLASAIAGDAGYVIPYYDLTGGPLPFYRVRLFNSQTKYLQAKGSSNHVYFPPYLNRVLRRKPKYFIITEGEKKAACAVKHGFAAVAFTGVDSWKSKVLYLPENAQMEMLQNIKKVRVKLPAGEEAQVGDGGSVAEGFQDVIDYIVENKCVVLIIYDSDREIGIKPEVQRAAATLGYELRFRGIPVTDIRQVVLPNVEGLTKVGLDDFLESPRGGPKMLHSLIRAATKKRVAFPRHPDPRGFINKKLQQTKLSRKEVQDISLSILLELEARGRRIKAKSSGLLYFFDETTHELMQVILGQARVPFHETEFASYLYREYNISGADIRLMQWFAAQFTGEIGVQEAETHKVLAFPSRMEDCIAYQLNKSHYIIVTPDPVEPFILATNGEYGLLFESNQVNPLPEQTLYDECMRQLDLPIQMWWLKVMNTLKFRDPDEMELEIEDAEGPRPRITAEQQRLLATLLCYISPWLLQWRGTQLPVEIVIGEAGSGKSSMYTLRQEILTGRPMLANVTADIKDWYAGITSRGGINVLDNVAHSSMAKDYRQRLSDEICRLVTEREPHVEMRRLYTTSDLMSMPVKSIFAITAIEQPFYNVDIIQRAAIFELSAIGDGHISDWAERQLALLGGRVEWLAHHLVTIHRFLKLAVHDRGWNYSYRASHRLANYEQCLQLMAESFGLDSDWIAPVLTTVASETMSESDWTLQGLRDFVAELKAKDKDWPRVYITSQMIAEWSEKHERYHKNGQLVNTWRLGRYIQSHQHIVERTCDLYEGPKRGNKRTLRIGVNPKARA